MYSSVRVTVIVSSSTIVLLYISEFIAVISTVSSWLLFFTGINCAETQSMTSLENILITWLHILSHYTNQSRPLAAQFVFSVGGRTCLDKQTPSANQCFWKHVTPSLWAVHWMHNVFSSMKLCWCIILTSRCFRRHGFTSGGLCLMSSLRHRPLINPCAHCHLWKSKWVARGRDWSI